MLFRQSAFDWPVAVYLALAGVAAGAALAAVFLLGRTDVRSHSTGIHAVTLSLAAALVGALCLVIDLEGPSRFWMVFVYANPGSAIGWGVRILSLFVLIATAVRLLAEPSDDRAAVSSVLRAALAASAMALATYPGFVLGQASGAVPLWRSIWLIPLFAVSGLHAGGAAVGFLPGGAEWLDSPPRRRAEIVVLCVLAVLVPLFSLDLFVLLAALVVGVLLPLAMLVLDVGGLRVRCALVLAGGGALRLWAVLAAQLAAGIR